MEEDIKELEKRLWEAADELRANSKLKASEYSMPVLGLIFLRYANHRFTRARDQLQGGGSGRRTIGKADYVSKIGFYVPEESRFDALLKLPEGANIGKEINEAMRAMERENPDLADVLPKSYNHLENRTLSELLKIMNSIPMDIEGDAFGRIYEYFLGEFAKAEGQKGGEFYTPTSIVKLIVNILEPYEGRILDPACGSGGMFVQSARFVEEHKANGDGNLSLYGQEKIEETVRLCEMNLAAHGLAGDIRQGNSYYEPLYLEALDDDGFDYVMANPPFNVDRVDKERLTEDHRFPYGLPDVDNANYLWIQMFYSALNSTGRAGFVMANSASDARHSEEEIRKQLIEDGVVDVIVAISTNFFYTVTLGCTLWFLDKSKQGTTREDEVLFIDARHLYRQVTRRIRDFKPSQIEFLSNIARLYRGEEPEYRRGSEDLMDEHFPEGAYTDVPGLCKVATRGEIEELNWSLHPGKYVGGHLDPKDEVELAEGVPSRLRELRQESSKVDEKLHQSLNLLGFEQYLNPDSPQHLEAAALGLFRSWFLQYDPLYASRRGEPVPGLDSQLLAEYPTELEDSELGPIPQGWEIKELEDIAKIILGRSPPSEYYNEEGRGPPFHQGVSSYGFRHPITDRWCEKDGPMAEPRDVLFSMRAPVGRINVADENLMVGRGLSALRGRDVGQSFLTYLLKSRFVEEDIIGHGTIYDGTNKSELSRQEFVIPPEPLRERFEAIAEVIDRKILLLHQEKTLLDGKGDVFVLRALRNEFAQEEKGSSEGDSGL